MKVVLLYDLGERFVEDLRSTFPSLDFRPCYTVEDQLREVPDAEVQFGLITREVYLASKKLKWFHFIGIGFDIIVRNIPEIVNDDVLMTYARQTHAIPMADHVFAMMLALAHNVPELIEDQRARRWDSRRYFSRMKELPGTTMGIVALGDIGKAVAKRAQGFDIEVYAVDILKMVTPPGVKEVWGVERIDDMLSISDWLVVTAPLTSQTRGMIDGRRIQQLKHGAIVVVVSRGSIVDEGALVDALRSGQVAGAGLDVFAEEPLSPQSPLWDVPNLLISPHVSADSAQLWERRREIFKENLRRYLAGETLLNVCDKRAGY